MASHGSLQLGLECLKDGRIDEAIRHFEEATARSPSDYQAFHYLGVAYAKKQLYNRAVGAFQTALRLRPDVPSLHYNLGLALQADGLPEQAREHFEEALRLDPGYEKASDALKALEKETSAIERVCARHPDEPAVGVCVFCRLPVCEECRTLVNGQIYCVNCASKQRAR